jgi:mRNA interferase HigB
MRVHLIKWRTVDVFVVKHARSRVSFEGFKGAIKRADWNSINDVQQTFGSADMIDNNRLVFNIGGNNFRLICSYWFGPNMVHLYVKWIGTHAEYTKLCKQKLQFSVDNFS